MLKYRERHEYYILKYLKDLPLSGLDRVDRISLTFNWSKLTGLQCYCIDEHFYLTFRGLWVLHCLEQGINMSPYTLLIEKTP